MTQPAYREWRTQERPPLIMVLAFDPDDEGELRPVVGPLEPRSENAAKTIAAALSGKHAGVIAWKRTAQPNQSLAGRVEPQRLSSMSTGASY